MRDVEAAKTRYGLVSYYADDEWIGRSLKVYGEYSEAEVGLWRKLVRPGDIVVDVGANIGYFTVALAELVGENGKVIAVEPQPDNFELLKINTRPWDQTEHYQTALGAKAGISQAPDLTDVPDHNYGRVELGSGPHSVQVETLGELLRNRIVRLIKIDVEGMEADVIEGGQEYIGQHHPFLYVENDRQEKSAQLLKLLRGLGYRLFEHKPLMFRKDNFRARRIGGEKIVVSVNVLALPEAYIASIPADQVADLTEGLRLLEPERPEIGRKSWAGIVRLGGIGDNLIAASVLRPLKEMGYRVDVISQEPQSCVFENNPYVDKLSVKSDKRDLPQNDPRAWNKYFRGRSYEYDKFVNLSNTSEGLLAHFYGSVQFDWPQHFIRQISNRSYLEAVHDAAGVPYTFGPLFFPTGDEKAQAKETRSAIARKKVIGWCITGSRIDKIYPPTALTIARLIHDLDAAVIMFGAPPPARDFAEAKAVQEWVIKQNGSESGLYLALSDDQRKQWPIRRMLSQVLACDLVIGPDTGPMWAAAMEPMPKIMLHSHASVTNITKHWVNTTSLHADPEKVPCWPCHLLHDNSETCVDKQTEAGVKVDPQASGAACISSIRIEAIVAHAAKLLKDPPATANPGENQ